MSVVLIGVLIGLLYAPICLGAAISFRVLSWPDLTLEGGALASAAATLWAISHGLSFPFAMASAIVVGVAAGFLTAFIRFRGGVGPLLAGIISASVLYSVFFHLTDGRANVALPSEDSTIFDLAHSRTLGREAAIAAVVVVLMAATISLLFRTRLGHLLRALGEEPRLLSQLGRSEAAYSAGGLALANGLVGLGISMVVQYRGVADVSIIGGLLISSLASIMVGELLVRPRTMTQFIIAITGGSVCNSVLVAFALQGAGRADVTWLLATDVRALIGVLLLSCGLAVRRLRQPRLFAGNW